MDQGADTPMESLKKELAPGLFTRGSARASGALPGLGEDAMAYHAMESDHAVDPLAT